MASDRISLYNQGPPVYQKKLQPQVTDELSPPLEESKGTSLPAGCTGNESMWKGSDLQVPERKIHGQVHQEQQKLINGDIKTKASVSLTLLLQSINK